MSYDNFGGPDEPRARVPLPGALRWVIVLGLCLLFVVAAFIGGWVAGRHTPKETLLFNTPVAPPPVDWTEFAYPGGEQRSVVVTGGVSFTSSRVVPGTTAVMVTADSFEKVITHYAQKLGQPGAIPVTGTGSTSGGRILPTGAEAYDCTHTTATRPGLKVMLISYRTTVYDLVLNVTRADGEKQTTIIIAYSPHP
jgi:hypothetical protein